MPIIDIQGIPVAFPFPPYPCQLDFMSKALETVRSADNAALESPTGTGKTLCLLCSLLAWQQSMKTANQLERSIDSNSNATKPGSPVPVIYYASRTHAQLSQVVRELRKTVYCPRMVVLSSREQSCLHERVKRIASGTAQAAICNRLCSRGQCGHFNRINLATTQLAKLSPSERLMDLEELGRFAAAQGACPFFTMRDGLAAADLVLLPYNYLLDRRTNSGMNLEGAIVVLDEAHNIVHLHIHIHMHVCMLLTLATGFVLLRGLLL